MRAKLLLGAGECSMNVSDHQQAQEWFTEARRIAQEINTPRIEAWALFYLMGNEVARLNIDAARVYGEQSLRIFQPAGALIGIGFVAQMQTMCDYFDRWRNNELTPEVAEDLMSKLEPVVAGARQLGERNLLGHALELLGRLALHAGRIEEASAHLSEAVTAFNTLGNQALVARMLDHVALLATRANQPAAAISLLGATTTLRQHLGVPAMLAEQFMFDRALDTARKNLTPEGFKDAWAEGTRMTRDQAVQQARTIIDAAAGTAPGPKAMHDPTGATSS
jgi:tetratricopeptide (TPR) repeat protein